MFSFRLGLKERNSVLIFDWQSRTESRIQSRKRSPAKHPPLLPSYGGTGLFGLNRAGQSPARTEPRKGAWPPRGFTPSPGLPAPRSNAAARSRNSQQYTQGVWNRLTWEQQMMSDANRLMRPGAARPMERSANGHIRVLPSCTRRIRCVLRMHCFSSSSGTLRTGVSLERLEPCEGKLSRTVLRGA